MQSEWQHSKECMCPLQNIAICVTTKKVSLPDRHTDSPMHTDRQTPNKVIRPQKYESVGGGSPYTVPYRAVCDWLRDWLPYLTQSPTELFAADGVVGGLLVVEARVLGLNRRQA